MKIVTYVIAVVGSHVLDGPKHGAARDLLGGDLVNDGGRHVRLVTGGQITSSVQT